MKRHIGWGRGIQIVLVILLIASLIIPSSLTQSETNITENVTSETEILTTYETSDGKTKLVIDSENPRYRTENGSLELIEEDFEDSTSISNKDYDYGVENGIYKLYFKSDQSDTEMMRIELPDGNNATFSFATIYFNDSTTVDELQTNSSDILSSGNSFVVSEFYSGMYVNYSYSAFSMKEEIVVDNLNAFGDINKSANVSESIVIFDWIYTSTGNVSSYLSEPLLYTSSKKMYSSSNYEYYSDKDGNHITFNVPYSLIYNAGESFIIDPSFTMSTGTLSGVLSYDSIIINGTITINDFVNSTTGFLFLNATDNITCGSAGCAITGIGRGFPGATVQTSGNAIGINGTGYNGTTIYGRSSENFCAGEGGVNSPGIGGTGGGSGASIVANGSGTGFGSSFNLNGFGNVTNSSIYMGCGGGGGGTSSYATTGGAGGDGGAGLRLEAGTLINLSNGRFNVNGSNGLLAPGGCGGTAAAAGSGGGAGKISINTTTLIMESSAITAYGGMGLYADTGSGSYCFANSQGGAGGAVVLSYRVLLNSSSQVNASGGWMYVGEDTQGNPGAVGGRGQVHFINWGGNVEANISSPQNGTLQARTVNVSCSAETDLKSLTNMSVNVYDSSSVLLFNESNLIYGSSNHTSFYLEFNQSGDYSYTCRAQNSYYNYAWTSSNATFTVDAFNPTVSLTSPANDTWVTNGNGRSFNCQVVGTNLASLTFHNNFTGTWHLNQTRTGLFSGNTYTFSSNISDGAYVWNCGGNKTSNSSLFFGATYQNFSFGVDSVVPLITSNITINTTAGSQTIQFSFNATDTYLNICRYTIYDSALVVDGTNSNVSITCNAQNSSTVTAFGNYTLRVYAVDRAGNSNTTTELFNVSQTVSAGGGESGGGRREEEDLASRSAVCGDGVCERSKGEGFLNCAIDCGSIQGINFQEALKNPTFLKFLLYFIIPTSVLILLFVGDRKRRKKKEQQKRNV